MGGEPTCLMQVQPFSYASGLPNEANEGNPVHALGQSISFGRFMSESLAWEKWSTFSHNRYVEEAERYSQPGSVAQKKAFFEAHYKKLAARKAAAAAALLEQANSASENSPQKPESGTGVTNQDSETTVSNSKIVVNEPEVIEKTEKEQDIVVNVNGYHSDVEKMGKFEGNKVEQVGLSSHVVGVDGLKVGKETELKGTAKMDKPLPKVDQEVSVPTSKKKTTLSSSKLSTKSAASSKSSNKASAPTATPMSKKSAVESLDKKRSTPKSLHMAVNFTPIRELNRLTSTVIRKLENSRAGASSSRATKDCPTPLRTPIMVSNNGTRQQPLETPCSGTRRATTPVKPSACGSKTAGAKWRLLPTENKARSPFSSTPFSLRTEERAAKRREKLEEKFNANQAQTEQLQTKVKDKPETETGKLRPSFCFKARPLPDFYKQRKTQKDDVQKVTHPQSPKLGSKTTPSKVENRNSQPHNNRPPVKNNGSKHFLGKTGRSPTCSLISRPARTTTITHENRSPNIQHG